MPWMWAVFSSLQQQALIPCSGSMQAAVVLLTAGVPGSAWFFLMFSINSRIQAVEAVLARECAVFLNGASLLKTCVEVRCKAHLFTSHRPKQHCRGHGQWEVTYTPQEGPEGLFICHRKEQIIGNRNKT